MLLLIGWYTCFHCELADLTYPVGPLLPKPRQLHLGRRGIAEYSYAKVNELIESQNWANYATLPR